MQQQSLATTAEREIGGWHPAGALRAMLGWTDIRLRYRRSVIGPFWITLSMGTFILLLGVIYARLFNMDIKTYLPFLTAGYLVWGFISAGANEGCNAFHEGGQILKQIRLPYSLHIFRVLWRNFIVFLHTLVVFPLVCIYFGRSDGQQPACAANVRAALCQHGLDRADPRNPEHPISRRAADRHHHLPDHAAGNAGDVAPERHWAPIPGSPMSIRCITWSRWSALRCLGHAPPMLSVLVAIGACLSSMVSSR